MPRPIKERIAKLREEIAQISEANREYLQGGKQDTRRTVRTVAGPSPTAHDTKVAHKKQANEQTHSFNQLEHLNAARGGAT
jgi:uncharacterized protein YdaU (DUF1376 family)